VGIRNGGLGLVEGVDVGKYWSPKLMTARPMSQDDKGGRECSGHVVPRIELRFLVVVLECSAEARRGRRALTEA